MTSWLEDHLENFVKPTIYAHEAKMGFPNANGRVLKFDESQLTPLGYFLPEEMTVIKNTWRAIKKNAQGKQILLPGRDVFIFEILARREGYPTIFMPECSRVTVGHIAQTQGHKLRNCYLFDTGFAGSIPKAMRSKQFGLLSYQSFMDPNRGVGTQIFPRLTWSRGLVLKIESTPKYWESGRITQTIDDSGRFKDEVLQPLSRIEEFIKAARLTIEVYKDSSPKFVKKHKPISHPASIWY